MRPPYWKILSCLFLLIAFYAFDYSSAKSIKLEKPLDLPNILSGTFGELRGSHFHAGIDIKTMGKEGFSVKSIEKGYVSRIKISPYGYGKAIYINHPNGLTSVYAHLADLSPKIKQKIYELMISDKTNEIDQYFEPDAMPVEANEIIAISGNTGGSMGPHLHFELRETALQIPVNPLLYSYEIVDNEAPQIKDIYLYNLETSVGIERPVQASPKPNDTLRLNSTSIGVAINTFDRQDGNRNRNGVYSIELVLDSLPIFQLQMDKISYSESRYIQAHCDPLIREKNKQSVHRCFILPGDALSIYQLAKDAGRISLRDSSVRSLQINIGDINGNIASKKFKLILDGESDFFDNSIEDLENRLAVSKSQKFDFEGKNWRINIPSNSFYYDTYIQIEERDSSKGNLLSNKLMLRSNHFNTHRKFSINFKSSTAISKPEKVVIVYENGEEYKYLTTDYSNGNWSTRSRGFGNYFLVSDTTQPEFLDFKLDAKAKKAIFYAKDTQSGIVDYHAYVNGEWHICYYDAKNDAFEIECKNCFEQSETELVLKLSDEKNNILSITKNIKN